MSSVMIGNNKPHRNGFSSVALKKLVDKQFVIEVALVKATNFPSGAHHIVFGLRSVP